MLKKLFVTAAAAAAMSVPLAGVAWAEPPADPGSNGNGIGAGGVPEKTGNFLRAAFPNAPEGEIPTGKVPPGSVFKQAAKVPDANTPDGYGAVLEDFYQRNGLPFAGGPDATQEIVIGPTVPGSVTKLFTPGCGHGNGPQPAVSVNGTSIPVPCA